MLIEMGQATARALRDNFGDEPVALRVSPNDE
jgi:hypothetical protein